MSDSRSRSAPLVTILAVMVGFALFAALVYYVYVPPQTGPFTDDRIHTMAIRKQNLAALLAKQAPHDAI